MTLLGLSVVPRSAGALDATERVPTEAQGFDTQPFFRAQLRRGQSDYP